MNTGYTVPIFGFGTYKIAPKNTQKLVETALEVGIRHIDTAQMYGNEHEVGSALKAVGLKRNELFVTTKLNNCNHERDDARRSFGESLDALGLDYVDLFLIHWPLPTLYGGDYVSTWRTMLEFFDDGRAKSVGVSNFQINHLQRIIEETQVVPAVNQVEAHPKFPNNAVRRFNQRHGIVTEAWSPLGRGSYFDDPVLQELSRTTGKTPAQLMLRWAIQRGDVVFPKASSRQRIEENMSIFEWELNDTSMACIDGMDRGEAGRRGSHPDTMNLLRTTPSA